MPKTVILGAARTPFGKLGGGISTLDAMDLGGTAISAALERAEVAPEQVQHVSYGHVLQAGQGQIPSRQAQIKAGIPREVPSETINKVCASGMRALGLPDQAVRAGDLDVAVTGGMEAMSQAPHLLPGARFGFRLGRVEGIVEVTVKSRKGESTVETDEAIRPDTTLEVLSKLKAVGGDDATHTAGNSPGVNDGAGAVIVASDEWAQGNGREVLARVLS